MNIKYFNMAKVVSKQSPSRFKLGCVVVNKNKVLSKGFNQMHKTHPRCKTWGNFVHAELNALINLPLYKSYGASIYVYRETAEGIIANSKPCNVCMNTIIAAGIKKIYYTTNNGFHMEKL